MNRSETLAWLSRSPRRREALLEFNQPLTTLQLAKRMRIALNRSMATMKEFRNAKLVVCLTPNAPRSRIYGLTPLGNWSQRRLCREIDRTPPGYECAQVDWDTYAWVCFSHRATVIRTLNEPLQPASIKRLARRRDPELRMKASNVRDILKLFLVRGLVRTVKIRKRAHLRYELTEVGLELQKLLNASIA